MKRLSACVAVLLGCGLMPSAGAARDAILPQGDPRLKSTPAEEALREDIRDSRLKQQGQGSNYRVEGQLQGGTSEATAGDSTGPARPDTGLSDPSVNPGQASGMQRVQGRIVQSQDNKHTVRQATGGDTTIVIDEATSGDRDLRPGDVVSGTVTAQGRAVVVQKAKPNE